MGGKDWLLEWVARSKLIPIRGILVNKRVVIKNRIFFLTICLIFIALIIILANSALHILFADYYYHKYLTAKLKPDYTQLLGYITKSLSLDETNPDYLHEFGNAFLEAPLERDIDSNVDSTLIITKDDGKVSRNSLRINNFNFLKKYENSNNPLIIPMAAYKESIRNNPLNANAYFNLGVNAANRMKTENIDSLFTMASKMDPHNTFINYYIGNYYIWNQNLEKALSAFREIFAVSNSSGRFFDSYFLYIVSEVYLVDSEFNTLAKINPSSYRAYLLLANFLKSKNRWEDSKKAYYRAIKLAPWDKKSDMIYRFAAISASNKDWEEIKEIDERFRHYISSDKNTNRSFTILFLRCFYDQKDYREVIKRAEEIIDIDPYDYQPYYYKGLSLFNLGRKGEGLSQLEKAARLSPENIGLLRTLARFYESSRLYDKALAKWQLIMALTKGNVKEGKLYSEALDNIMRIKTKLNLIFNK